MMGNLCFRLKGPKGQTDPGCERIEKTFWFCAFYLYLKDSAFSAVK